MVRQAKDQKRQAAEARQALLALKFRALSLLDAFLTKHPASPHTPFLAAPLLRALRAAAAPSGDAQLATRLAVVVSERLSKGKIQGAAGLAKDDAKELLRSSLVAVARAPTGPDAGVVLEAAERVAMYAVR